MARSEAVFRQLSRVSRLPVLDRLSPSGARAPSAEEKEGYLACQRLAQRAALEVAGLVREGWTEKQTAVLLNTYLRDSGVTGFFHQAFVWFGERTRFDGVRALRYDDYSPTRRVLQPGEVFILDVAPILDGYVCDIGYVDSLGPNAALREARHFLRELRDELPGLFMGPNRGRDIWRLVDKRIVDAGYENVHAQYPFSVLGHRVHRVPLGGNVGALNFGWQSYWSFLSRGLFGQLLNGNHDGSLDGLWAIEPHIGTNGDGVNRFGAKFEELLLVEQGSARWLDAKAPGL